MQISAMHFKRKASENLHDAKLQYALEKLQTKFVVGRSLALEGLPDYAQLSEQATQLRDHTIKHLAHYLDAFEQRAQAAGSHVHWAENTEDVSRILVKIAQEHNVKKAVKSKSMVTEECSVNEALESNGVQVIETDLGEYILQLAQEPPSHIVAPVIHKSKEDIADLFEAHHRVPRKNSIAEMCREAREILRPHFLSADMGITGANFLVAETGSVLIVTNEGNGRLVTTLPKIHVAITGIEKVVPTLDDVALLLRLLPRSATGQPITNYVSLLTGTDTAEGNAPEHSHIILVDNGRSQLLGTNLQSMLRCIRCGACMNHCPVYQNIGGHAYGWVYPGPMGSVLTPVLAGVHNAVDLPNASTFCGKCAEVCPVKIPLPDLMRNLRERQVALKLRTRSERLVLKAWAWFALHPRCYRLLSSFISRLLHILGGKQRRLRHLPFAGQWTSERDLPAPASRTFHASYRGRKIPGRKSNERP